jgi:hypothetical protein
MIYLVMVGCNSGGVRRFCVSSKKKFEVLGIEIYAVKVSAAARGLHDGLVVRGGNRPIEGRKGVFC